MKWLAIFLCVQFLGYAVDALIDARRPVSVAFQTLAAIPVIVLIVVCPGLLVAWGLGALGMEPIGDLILGWLPWVAILLTMAMFAAFAEE